MNLLADRRGEKGEKGTESFSTLLWLKTPARPEMDLF